MILFHVDTKLSEWHDCSDAAFLAKEQWSQNDRTTGTPSFPTSAFKSRFKAEKKEKKTQLCTAAAAEDPDLTHVKTQLLIVFGAAVNHSNYAIVILPSWLNWMNASTGTCSSENQCINMCRKGHVWSLRRSQPRVTLLVLPERSACLFSIHTDKRTNS